MGIQSFIEVTGTVCAKYLYPLQYSSLQKSMDYPWGHSQTRLSDFHFGALPNLNNSFSNGETLHRKATD